MTQLKIQGKPSAGAVQALQPHVERWYRRSGVRSLAIVELAHVERTEPAKDAEKDRSVTMRISSAEVPDPDSEDSIREVMRALYLLRTATGTLDEEGNLSLSQQTLKHAAGIIGGQAIARLSAGVQHWRQYVDRVGANNNLTLGELHHELGAIRDGLAALLVAPAGEDGGE